jgi:hypothetical protein
VATDTAVEIAPNQTLFAIVDTLLELNEMVETAKTDEERAVAQEELERVVCSELAHKVDSYGWFDKQIDIKVDGIKKNILAEAAAEIASLLRSKARVRYIARDSMQRLGIRSLKGQIKTISLMPGVETPDIFDEDLLPAKYKTTKTVVTTVIDRDAVLRDLKAGVEVPGAQVHPGEEFIKITGKRGGLQATDTSLT